MSMQLKLLTKQDTTTVPRVLRIIASQGFKLQKLVLELSEDATMMNLAVVLDKEEGSVQLLKLLRKQINVFDVSIDTEELTLIA